MFEAEEDRVRDVQLYREMRTCKPSHLQTVKTNSSTSYEQLFRQYSFAKKIQGQTAIRQKLHKTLLYEKAARKMLMKLTPGKNFQDKMLLHIFQRECCS